MYKYFVHLLLLCTILSFNCGWSEEAPITVWGVKVSPYVRKVLVALEAKEMPYELKEVLPAKLLKALGQDVSEVFSKVSPLGKIPAIEQGSFAISDSSVIAAYLEKIHPKHPIYPQDAQQFAQALWLEEYADSVMSETIHGKIFTESFIKPNVFKMAADEAVVKQAVTVELPVIFDYLEKQLVSNGGTYLVGETLSIADISVANHLVSLKLTGINIDAKKWPSLARYEEEILKEPAFKAVISDLIK